MERTLTTEFVCVCFRPKLRPIFKKLGPEHYGLTSCSCAAMSCASHSAAKVD